MKLIKRLNLWEIKEVAKGRVLAKPYFLNQIVRIEFEDYAVHLTIAEAATLRAQLAVSMARLLADKEKRNEHINNG